MGRGIKTETTITVRALKEVVYSDVKISAGMLSDALHDIAAKRIARRIRSALICEQLKSDEWHLEVRKNSEGKHRVYAVSDYKRDGEPDVPESYDAVEVSSNPRDINFMLMSEDLEQNDLMKD